MKTRSKECISLVIYLGPHTRSPSIELYFWERKPLSTPEIHWALPKIENLLRTLPTIPIQCEIPVGDNVAEIRSTIEDPILGSTIKEMMAHIKAYLVKEFPHKPDKIDIYDEIIE